MKSHSAADTRPNQLQNKSPTGFLPPAVPLAMTHTNGPWTHTSDDSYMYQLSLVVAIASISFTPCTIRYVIRYFSFNMLRRRPTMHIEGFNMHALEGAIHIAISISFVAVAAICIDKTNIFLTSRAICIVLTIRWSMSNAIHIAVYNIATNVRVNAYYSDQYDSLQYLQYVLSY